ncbi:MAG: M56 family metallopeptidase, partial [Acetatifactor sp.]|nr:M56 family metallopeptidase [Acetatifactor sp.]
YLLLKRKVTVSIEPDKGVRVCDEVESPFILGIFKPVIYVPSDMSEELLRLVLAHERAHLKRCDYLWKPLGFFLLSLYWFNPFCWLAYVLLCRDIEAACDEKVIRDKPKEYIVMYSQALLNCSIRRRTIAACPLAFGETGVKTRVKGILNYKKPTFWVMIAAFIVCVAVTLCFMTNPKEDTPDLSLLNYKNAISLIAQEGLELVAIHSEQGDESAIILPAMADGENVIHYLENVNWKQRRKPFEALPSPGSIEFLIDEEYRITVYKNPKIARVVCLDGERYYRIKSGDYEKALELLHPYTTNETEEKASTQEPVRPEVNLTASEGADQTEILYADKNKIIFSGYYGLFVYSKVQGRISNALDLEAIGCHFTQGDNYCEKYISEDGNTVYLHPLNNDKMFIYNIATDSLQQETYNLSGISFHEMPGGTDNNPGDFDGWETEAGEYYTLLHHGSMIGDLCYADVPLNTEAVNIQWEPLFSPGSLSGAVDFAPEDVHDIVSADIWVTDEASRRLASFGFTECQGQLLHCENDAVLREIEKLLSDATKEKGQTNCPFFTALYLTREDGTVGMVSLATDGCATYNSAKGCYKMPEKSGERLWKLITEFQGVHVSQEVPNQETEENIDVNYTFQNGVFVADGGREFKYKTELIGRGPGALSDSKFIVLTNNPDITFDEVFKSLISSNSADFLTDTVIIGMGTIEKGDTLQTGRELSDWMNIDLPKENSVSEFADTIGYMGGFLIQPDIYTESTPGTPKEWLASGMVSRIWANNTKVEFDENHAPKLSGVPIHNHTDAEYLTAFPIEQEVDGWYAIMLREAHELDATHNSEYWYFWYVKDGEDMYYVLSLNTEVFVETEAKEIAGNVQMNR